MSIFEREVPEEKIEGLLTREEAVALVHDLVLYRHEYAKRFPTRDRRLLSYYKAVADRVADMDAKIGLDPEARTEYFMHEIADQAFQAVHAFRELGIPYYFAYKAVNDITKFCTFDVEPEEADV